MSVARVRSLAVFAAVLAFPASFLGVGLIAEGDAQAQVDTRWQAGMSAQVGVTDNVAQTPDAATGDLNAVLPEADGLAVLSPTIAFIFETASSSHTLAYGFGATLYFTHSEANAYSNGLGYTSRYTLSPTVDLALGAGVAYTQTNAFNLLGGANATVVGLQPADPVEVVSVTAAEGIEVALSPVWSINQTVSATALVQLDNGTPNYLLTGTVGATREFTRDTFGMGVGSDFLFQPETEDAAGNRQLLLRVFGSWTHALSDQWSTSLTLGGVLARQLGQAVDGNDLPIPTNTVVQPYGVASIDYQDDFGNAGISIDHNVAPNVLTGSAQLTDTATLRAGLPFGESGFALAATGAVGTARLLQVDGNFGEDVVLIFVADAGLAYTVPALPELSFDLRYQFTRQAPADGELSDNADVQAITRNTVLLGATIVWPPAEGGAGNAAGATSVFRPTPGGNQDILQGVRDAREQAVEEEESQGRRERRNGERDTDGQYDGVRGGGGAESEE